MSWHNYANGQHVPLEDIIATCEDHIRSGGVTDPDGKQEYLQRIRDCGHELLVYSPQGDGWGSSPINPNSWQTIDGESIARESDEQKRYQASTPERVWLFQANPRYSDIAEVIRNSKPGDIGTWGIMSYRKRVKPKDAVVFWLSGEDGGICALGQISSEPYERKEEVSEEEAEHKPFLKHRWLVDYRYTDILSWPIPRDLVAHHPALRDLAVIKFPNATNYQVESSEWTAIKDLVNHMKNTQPHPSTKSEEFIHLLRECKSSYLDTPKGAEHLRQYDPQRAQGRENYEETVAMAERGEDITEQVLSKLLPHAETTANVQRGAWIHVARAVTKDIRVWFERAGWRKPEDWPEVAQMILRFVRQCANGPAELPSAAIELSASPYKRGLKLGILTPILNALRPDDFLIVNSKTRKVINYFTSANYENTFEEYPEINEAGKRMLHEFGEELRVAAGTGARESDALDAFTHWLVAIKKFDFTGLRQGGRVIEQEHYWKIAPGENASLWEMWREEGYVSIGWSDLGDLSGISREDFEERRDEGLETHSDWTKEGIEQVWRFIQIREGDRVVANKGTSEILGIGTVTGPYYFVPDEEHGHRLSVRWDDLTMRKIEEGGWRKALIEISREKFGALLQPPSAVDGETQYSLAQCTKETGLEMALLERWVRAIDRKGQAIIYGPPGTGKTFVAERLAKHMASRGGFSEIVQFHPAYAYEDFIQGIRPQTKDGGGLYYPVVLGRFLDFCSRAKSHPGTCVLIIDEINRANLSRVFGELMYLLEYRKAEVPLASGGAFKIPENVRLIGTMNTADRSIALVDHALRRRFAFLQLYPNYKILQKYHEKTGFPVEGLIAALVDVNREIEDRHYEIGTSFFLREKLAAEIEDIWRMEIVPYLEEYFFDQPGKVDQFQWESVRQKYGL